MVKLLLIADDFTGAMDTGVQFSKMGINTFVATKMEVNFEEYAEGFEVLALSTDSRHDAPEVAYQKIYDLVQRAKAEGITYFYKKTDSAMRGNIGAELTALRDATGEDTVAFVPAYPDFNRITLNGIQMINGIPVNLSNFVEDPFSPVKIGSIKDIIAMQSDVPVVNHGVEDPPEGHGILVYDAASDKDMRTIGEALKNHGKLRALSGCAGFASVLPSILELKQSALHVCPQFEKLLMVSGSVNDITIGQLEYISQQGVKVFTLTPRQKLDKNFLQELQSPVGCALEEQGLAVIATAGNKYNVEETSHYATSQNMEPLEVRSTIMGNIGNLAELIVDAQEVKCLAVVGGDTLKSVIEAFHCEGIIPYGEIDNGTVYGAFICRDKTLYLVSKSGGLGGRDALWNVICTCLTCAPVGGADMLDKVQ